ncbi:hypothetical protein SAMN04487975_11680 [Planococcus glaciei]|uniref:hypothetical protein n=1 Tax=Planococcus glaciei TaxID=459472 RepID=UPI0008815A62|nr:hypothetical protein [Planococcus glaciei]SDI41649.1 hypothetical protein SAMN04487975_11680 [Planococcus glaciei]
MTYCVAWKSNNEIYVLADSLTSSESESEFNYESPFSSMGEVYGQYDTNYIGETDTKIYYIENIVVAFSGVINVFSQVKETIELLGKTTCIELIVNSLKEIVGDSDLIIAIKNEEDNRLYHLNKLGFKEVNDFIAIGSGSDITELNNLMREFFLNEMDPEYEPQKKVSAATAYIQMLSLKNNYLNVGVGGTFCGVCIHEKIEWNDDFLYFLYDEKFEVKKLINVIIRKNTIITGSDFTGLTKAFKYKYLSENEGRKMLRYIQKCIQSYIPRYVVFYSSDINNIYFCDIYNKTHTLYLRIFQRRGKVESKTEIYTSPYLVGQYLLNNKNEEKMIIPFDYIDIPEVQYIQRDELIEKVENIQDVEFEYNNFDFPLEYFSAPIDISDYLNKSISDYENLLLVNMKYLKAKIFELSEFYKELNIEFDLLQILIGLRKDLETKFEVEEFKVLLFGNQEELENNDKEKIEFYQNEPSFNFEQFTNSLLLNFYKDFNYYHLDKIVILDDSSYFNDLFEILPEYNRVRTEADIFLIRNHNFESDVLYSPFYFCADTLIPSILGLPKEAFGLWVPDVMSEEEKLSTAHYLNSIIDNY